MKGFVADVIVPLLISLAVIAASWWFLFPVMQRNAERNAWSPHAEHTMLVVMVRNEAPIIERMLVSFRGRIAKHVFVCDTGSTDGTLDIVLNGAKHTASPFVNFEQSRNECLAAATRSLPPGVEWIVLSDADFTAELNWQSRQTELTADVYSIHVRDAQGLTYPLHMLVRARTYATCRYRLYAHEYLDCGANVTYGIYDGFSYRDHNDGSSRAHKLTRDIALLESWLRVVNETDLRPRALYYLARAYEDSGQYGRALQTYRQHNDVQPYTNYQFYARYRIGLVMMKQNATAVDVERAMLEAHEQYDGYFRHEPLTRLAGMYAGQHKWARCLLYASAAMGVPAIDHSRMPLFMEPDLGVKSLREHCANKLKL